MLQRKSKLLAFLFLAFATSATAQYRTYRVVDNGVETIGYCKLSAGRVTHKFTSLPENGGPISANGNGSFTVPIPEYSNSEEQFFVGDGVSFDQVFNSIHARYCIRQGYYNFKEALKEKDPIIYKRKIKAILGYYENARRVLSIDERAEAMAYVENLSQSTEAIPFMKGKPAKGYLPEYVRLVEKTMNAILIFDKQVKTEYNVVVHKSPVKADKDKRKRRR